MRALEGGTALEARTRLGVQPLHVQSATHAGAGRGEARVLEARTRLGAQPLRVQSATHAGAGGEAKVLEGLRSVAQAGMRPLSSLATHFDPRGHLLEHARLIGGERERGEAVERVEVRRAGVEVAEDESAEGLIALYAEMHRQRVEDCQLAPRITGLQTESIWALGELQIVRWESCDL